MRPLRNLSQRPELIVDEHGFSVYHHPDHARLGLPAPFGRARVVFALPTNCGPVQVKPPTVVHDEDGFHLADPDGALIGRAGIHISRMLAARWTEDTRRIAG